ncbi:beta-glucosidase [Arachidicoccus ginsenosidimutans]|uniref:beta-glucosidase BglX n=1 Tax=Arachidicoccus sp. BS20 TaxID=1850526 RepID=UPI0007F1128C|nr:beta-glucosidase BglX [Arachidicoccus sp. BS20]ANI89233.1 beta-glucosidase [Arachidicoccus sp. BS20]
MKKSIVKIFSIAIIIFLHNPLLFAQQEKEFIDNLMSKMTLDEKIGQLNLSVVSGGAVTGNEISKDINQRISSGEMGGLFGIWDVNRIKKLQDIAVKNSRLHIPLIFGLDVIHGHKTIFPVPLALSASWDTALVRQVARIAAIEASADGVNWVFSPMVDISRDARWGRVVEGSGEDPFLGSQMAKAMVEGYQQNFGSDNTVMACVKHFALYGAVVAGREYNSVDMSPQQMYQYYFPPYKAAVDAGVGSVMTSFNDLNGLPSSANKWLLTDVLRKQWNFKGFTVSDYSAVGELMNHGLGDEKTISALAINAGTNMEMVGEHYLHTLKQLIGEGKVSEQTVDDACRVILEAKYKLGLFQNPYLFINPERPAKEILTQANKNFARKAAEHSFVLLKNNQQTLPLQTKGTIAVIGPLADSKENMLGAWNVAGETADAVSVLDGIKSLVGSNVNIIYQKGANITDDALLKKRVNVFKNEISTDKRTPEQMIADAVKAAQQSDVIVAVVGEAADMTGESASRTHINIPASQEKLLKALKQTGKPLVAVLFNGRPLTLNWENDNCDAILDVWFGGTEAGNAVADVLFGKYNPSGKITMSFPKDVGQVPIYYNRKNTGRYYDEIKDGAGTKYKSDYLDVSNEPLYPFGFGLSYTTFSYGKIRLSNAKPSGNETVKATVTITNTGKFAGEETAQLYITDPVARVTRSVEDLKGFQKVFLQPGESRDVTFNITPNDLKYYDYDLKYDWDAGEFIVRIGSNSRDTQSAAIDWSK